jgi:ATP-dependent helicase/nuclease subunit A
VQDGNTILIVDYKTNRPPPREVAQVAEAYLLQLAAYGLAVKRIFPGLHVRAALLWTDGPRLMEIPPPVLEAQQQRLWQLEPASLDA